MRKSIYLLLSIVMFAALSNAQYFDLLPEDNPIRENNGASSYASGWIDIDNDGQMDVIKLIYGAKPKVFVNKGNALFEEAAIPGFGEEDANSIAIAIADYNNDGFDDVFICNTALDADNSQNHLYKNNGNGTFTKVTDAAIDADNGWAVGASFIDYNNDGFLDIFVVNVDEKPNRLFKNNGDGSFTNITDAGAIVTDVNSSFSAAWGDYNNDGYIDCYVANAYWNNPVMEPNCLYKNNGDGTFTKITDAGDIVTDANFSHGASWGDYNNDGLLDVVVTSHDISILEYKKPTLYRNNGDGTFTKITNTPLNDFEKACMGNAWMDVDNDGNLDLCLSVVKSSANSSQNVFYKTDNDGLFTQITTDTLATHPLRTYGLSIGDFTNDGFVDIVNSGHSGSRPDGVYQNKAASGNNWIGIKLQGVESNRNGIGARITYIFNDQERIREVVSATGQYVSSDMRQILGIAQATSATVVVNWPSGIQQTLTDLAINQYHVITEEKPKPINCTITCPEDILRSLVGEGTSAVVEYDIEYQCEKGTDLAELKLISGLASGESFPLGTTAVTYNLEYDGEVLDACTFNVTVEPGVGIENTDKINLKIYPNPVTDILNIETEQDISVVTVYDLTGKKVLERDVNDKKAHLSLSSLDGGAYILRVQTTDNAKSVIVNKQ